MIRPAKQEKVKRAEKHEWKEEKLTEANNENQEKYEFLVRNLIEMQKIFRKVDSWEEVLDLPKGWKAEKAGDPNLPQEWNIKQKWTPLFKQHQSTTPTTNVRKSYQYLQNWI